MTKTYARNRHARLFIYKIKCGKRRKKNFFLVANFHINKENFRLKSAHESEEILRKVFRALPAQCALMK